MYVYIYIYIVCTDAVSNKQTIYVMCLDHSDLNGRNLPQIAYPRVVEHSCILKISMFNR